MVIALPPFAAAGNKIRLMRRRNLFLFLNDQHSKEQTIDARMILPLTSDY